MDFPELPYDVSLYLRRRFGEECRAEVKRITNEESQTFYEVSVVWDNYRYRLLFKENGELVREFSRESYPHQDATL